MTEAVVFPAAIMPPTFVVNSQGYTLPDVYSAARPAPSCWATPLSLPDTPRPAAQEIV